MTTIVALTKGKHITIGGDRQVTAGFQKGHLAQAKVFRSGAYLIGFSGALRFANLLQHSFVPPLISPGQSLEEFFVTDFVDGLRRTLSDAGNMSTEDNVENSGGQALIGTKGRLFRLSSDFAVAEVNAPYTAIGSGADYALGSLFSTAKGQLTPVQRITLALKAACEHDSYTGGNLDILTTQVDKTKG